MLYQPAIETMPLPKLRNLQDERLRQLVTYCYERIPFYRHQLDMAGINPERIRGIADLHLLPFTKKQDLRDQYPFGLFAIPREEVIRIHASSGTTGKPTVVGYSRNDLELFSEVVARSLVAAGCRPGMMLQNAYGYGLFTGGLGIHYGAEKLGMTVVPVSGGLTERQLLLLQDFRPDAISCTPSYAQTLAGEVQQRGIQGLNLKIGILGAEPWTEAIRADVEAGLGIDAVNIYGLSEIIGPGVSNEDFEEKGTGSYVWEDHFFPEIVDSDTGEPLPLGQEGVLVFTTLTKEAMPLLRYWTNDITSLTYDYSQKRTHVKMAPIRGRADDMLIIRGVNLFQTQIEEIINQVDHLSAHYQLIVRREKTLDEVELRIEITPESSRELGGLEAGDLVHHPTLRRAHAELNRLIKELIGLSIRITLCEPGDIPRSEGGKLSRVRDERT
ncbi:MAG: AMP-binding protein [Lewinellaceae bacterium]|nr:AMP-binding protein [Lewinellaceae bacterium]